MSATRLPSADDAESLARLLQGNRDFLAPWEPIRPENYFTIEGQRDVITAALAVDERSAAVPHVIVDVAEQVVGRVMLNEITRGAFQSCDVGHRLGEKHNGKGLATAAVREQHCNFTEFDMAPNYLKIAGQWQDHLLYQLLSAGVN